MKYIAKNDTFLKKLPVEASTLEEDEKVLVKQGRIFHIEEVIDSEGLHLQIELDFDAGSWWIFLPHWTPEESGEVKATFFLKQARTHGLIYGWLTFSRGDQEILKVKATSGQAGYQHAGAHTIRAKGCIPPDNDWKISTNGYQILHNPGVNGMFYHITPDPDPETGRSEFGIHRDANELRFPGSAGCIVIKTNDFNNKVVPMLNGLRDKQSYVSLEVVYT